MTEDAELMQKLRALYNVEELQALIARKEPEPVTLQEYADRGNKAASILLTYHQVANEDLPEAVLKAIGAVNVDYLPAHTGYSVRQDNHSGIISSDYIAVLGAALRNMHCPKSGYVINDSVTALPKIGITEAQFNELTVLDFILGSPGDNSINAPRFKKLLDIISDGVSVDGHLFNDMFNLSTRFHSLKMSRIKTLTEYAVTKVPVDATTFEYIDNPTTLTQRLGDAFGKTLTDTITQIITDMYPPSPTGNLSARVILSIVIPKVKKIVQQLNDNEKE